METYPTDTSTIVLAQLTAAHAVAVDKRSDAHSKAVEVTRDDPRWAPRVDQYTALCVMVDQLDQAIAAHLNGRTSAPADIVSQLVLPDRPAVDQLRSTDIASRAPGDPMGASVVKRGRSKRGATSVVVKHGDAPVVGALDRDVNGRPLLATTLSEHHLAPAGAMARTLVAMRDSGQLRRLRGGWRASAVTRATYGLGDGLALPGLLGADTQSWEQMHYVGLAHDVCVHVDTMAHDTLTSWWDYPARPIVVTGRRRIAGSDQAVTVRHSDQLTADTLETRRARRHTIVKHQPRTAVKVGRGKRASDPTARALPGMLRAIGAPFTAPALCQAIRWQLVAPAHDIEHRYVGHQLVKRAPVKVKRGGRAARTIATMAPVANIGAVVDQLAPGDRVEVVGRYRYTITRGDSGRYAYTAHDQAGAVVVKRGGVRSAAGTASRIAALDAATS